jgi:tetratricopeptide (TPR) repeat protein
VELAPEGDLAIELLLLRAELALRTNHPREAVSLAERSRALAEKAGDRYEAARAYRVLAAAARNSGDADRAEGLLTEGIQILRDIETPFPLAQALLDLGRLAVDRLTLRSDVDRVLLHLEEALRLFRALGIERGRGEALLALARAHVRTAAFDRAAAFLAEATTIFRGMDMPEALSSWPRCRRDRGRFVEESVSHLNEFRATTRIQEILDARVDTMTRIGRILEVIAEAVEADGAMLVSTTFAAGDEPVAFRRVAPAVARALSPRLARLEGRLEGRPQIILNSEACADPDLSDMARRNSAITMILVPLCWTRIAARSSISIGPARVEASVSGRVISTSASCWPPT